MAASDDAPSRWLAPFHSVWPQALCVRPAAMPERTFRQRTSWQPFMAGLCSGGRDVGLDGAISALSLQIFHLVEYLQGMYPRDTHQTVLSALDEQAAVVLLGPRQVGKTTLALAIAETRPSVYLDLEREADRAVLARPTSTWTNRWASWSILDEVQQMPGLFAILARADRCTPAQGAADGAVPAAGVGVECASAPVGRVAGGPGPLCRDAAPAAGRGRGRPA